MTLHTSQKHANMWCPAMDLHFIQGVFLSHVHCSQDRLQIHHEPDQHKVVPEDERMNELTNEWYSGVASLLKFSKYSGSVITVSYFPVSVSSPYSLYTAHHQYHHFIDDILKNACVLRVKTLHHLFCINIFQMLCTYPEEYLIKLCKKKSMMVIWIAKTPKVLRNL